MVQAGVHVAAESPPPASVNGHCAPIASTSTAPYQVGGPSIPSSEAEQITSHLYTQGWKSGTWSDVNVYAGHRHYALHRLVIAQSPLLADYMRRVTVPSQVHSRGNPLDIVLNVHDANITDGAFEHVLGALYAPQSPGSLTMHNARQVLAAAHFLRVEAIAQTALQLCSEAIRLLTAPEDIQEWVAFVDAPLHSPPPSTLPSPAASQDGSLCDFGSNGGSPMMAFASVESLAPPERLRYGHYAIALRECLLHQLAIQLPQDYSAFASTSRVAATVTDGTPTSHTPNTTSATGQHGSDALLRAYAHLPFGMLKSIIEGGQLRASDMERFHFAKRIVSERKRLRVSAEAEETVVLAFGQGGQNVVIVRKPRRGRHLWKAGAGAAAAAVAANAAGSGN